MKVYHVALEAEDGWYCAQALEDPAVFTQGRSLDEVIENVREVAILLYREKDVQVELIVPPSDSCGREREAGQQGAQPGQGQRPPPSNSCKSHSAGKMIGHSAGEVVEGSLDEKLDQIKRVA